MALYEFLCNDCSTAFEHRMPMSDIGRVNVKCPQCHGKNTRKVFSQCNFKITPRRILAAKRAGLNIDKYEERKEKRDQYRKETGEKLATDDIVNNKINEIIKRGI